MLEVQAVSDPALRSLLRAHPRVSTVVDISGDQTTDLELRWKQGSHERSIFVGRGETPLKGIVELMDNNPLVCADAFSAPSPAGTLALLALGPLAEAGLIVERPTMLVNVEEPEASIAPYLEAAGWAEGLVVAGERTDLGGAVAATVIAAIVTPERLEDIDDLFNERYERSFFVRRDESSEWHVNLVIGKPFALYRLRIAADQPNSLLTIQVMADRNGKCGAAQVVHAMNVMCGFEESLGISG